MRIHHFAIEVYEQSRSAAFYINILGFKEYQSVIFNDEAIIMLELNGFKVELIENKAARGTEHIHLCFEVNNLAEQIRELAKNSLFPYEGPFELENGWRTVFYRGPDQEIIEFLET